MPPHCDAMDGPVVKAAIRAVEEGDVELIVPYAYEGGEREIRDAFEKTVAARKEGPAAKDLADRFFFETVVRVHRAGEGAAFTGLKPAGLDHGPVIPVAERAIESGSADDLVALLQDAVRHEVKLRFDRVMELKARADRGVPAAREYVSAMLGIQVYANKVYGCLQADPHAQHGDYEQGHVD